MSGGRASFTIDADLSGLESLMDGLTVEVEAAARPASQAAAQVLYEAVQKNVDALGKKTGNLRRSIYQVFSVSNSATGVATYHVSWNAKIAPHGGLVENGYLQRYRYYKGNDGQVRPMVRPGMEGTPRPGRRASQATKDAYFVTLPTPIQVPAKAFVRRATSQFSKAYDAAEAELLKRVDGALA